MSLNSVNTLASSLIAPSVPRKGCASQETSASRRWPRQIGRCAMGYQSPMRELNGSGCLTFCDRQGSAGVVALMTDLAPTRDKRFPWFSYR
jgi:hypothetical protein